MICENKVKQQTPVVFVWVGVNEAGRLLLLLLLLTAMNEFCRRWKERV